jgi:hypothetical protein
MCALQGDLEEGLKRCQDLIDQNPRDFRPYLCQVSLYANHAHNHSSSDFNFCSYL